MGDGMNYKGKEWLNLGVAFILFAVLTGINIATAIQQKPFSMSYFAQELTYAVGMLTVAMSLIFKKPLMSFAGLLITIGFVVNDFDYLLYKLGAVSNLVTFNNAGYSDLKLIVSIASIVIFAIVVLDFLDIIHTDINIGKSNWVTMGTFGALFFWIVIRLIATASNQGMGTPLTTAPYNNISSWMLNIMMLLFFSLGIITLLAETKSKEEMFGIKYDKWNMICFLVAVVAILITFTLRIPYGQGFDIIFPRDTTSLATFVQKVLSIL